MMKRTNKERFLAASLALVMLLGNVPTALATQTGLCDHHTGSGAMKDLPGSGDQPWRSSGDQIKKITVGSGITTVGNYMFTYLDQVTTVSLPEGITSIGASSFEWCKNLADIVFPSTLEQVGYRAFYLCESLTSAHLPSGVKGIGKEAFNRCTALSSVTVPGTVTKVGEAAFSQCPELKSAGPIGGGYDIEFGWTDTIPAYAFVGCRELTTVTLPSTLKKVADSAFNGCESLGKITFPASVTSIGEYAFSGTGITNITFKGSAPSIGDGALSYLTAIATCTADGSKSRTCQRSGCGATETETIPSGGHVENASTDIKPTCVADGRWGGRWCDACGAVFQEEVVRPATGVHTFVDGKCTGCGIVGGQCGDELYWTLKDKVLTIYGTGPMYDFEARKSPWHSKAPKTVVIEEGVTSIGAYSFAYQDYITGLTLPETVTRIGTHAFYSSENIVTIELPDSLETIESYAFWDCWVKELHLGPKAKVVDAYSFFGASRLESISVDPADPWFSELDGMLMSKDGKTLLVYPAGRRDTSFDVPISVTALGVRALANGYLVEVTLSPGITELPNSLFSGCGRLERVQLPVDLKKIGDNVFDYCDKLTEITIPAGVTGIGHGSFGDCESLTKITFLGNAPSFNISAFYGAALDVYYPGQNATWTEDVLQDYSGDINWIPYYDDRRVDLDSDAFGDTVWIDGEPHSIVRDKSGCYVKLPDTETELLVTYTFHMESKDPHTQYPTGMRVFRITDDGTGKKAEEIVEFADLLQYSGSSIRITGNKGIRMITSIEKSKKDALTGQGLAGYTLVEYGTVLCWSSEITGGLTLDKSYARSNFAYKKGVADPVFAYSGSLVQYTNVLVGFTNDQCRDDIAMRSYIILEDADGDQVTIYGGTVHRSIGYIAYQNRAAFAPGSAAYDYVWEIIHHVYGDQYDAEYEG